MPDIQTMLARDVNSSRLAYCYVTMDGKRFLLMMAKNLEAHVDKTKKEVPILGQTGMGHKSSGWNGTGSMTIYQVTSMFSKLFEQYKNTGEDMYFDMQIVNQDKTSASGSQTVLLKNCNLDNIVVAAFDADGDWLEQDVDFTFDDFEIPETYTELAGVAQ